MAKGRACVGRGLLLDQLLRGLPHVIGSLGLRLQPMQIIDGLSRMAGGGEDRPLVVFQDPLVSMRFSLASFSRGEIFLVGPCCGLSQPNHVACLVSRRDGEFP